MPLRKPADWMKPADDRILELLSLGDERLWFTPKMIYSNLPVGDNWVQKRLGRLSDSGLVERNGTLYRLSDAGQAYLDGELDVSTLQESDD